MNFDMVHTYVRDLIERITGERPTIDDDGDLHFRHLDAGFFARLHPETPVVQIFSIAVDRPQPSRELFEALNDLNTELLFARGLYVGSQILIEQDLHASDLSPRTFDTVCREVAAATDQFARPLAERFTGQLAFDFEKGENYATQAQPADQPKIGFYP